MLPPSSQPATPERRLRVLLCGYGHLGLALLRGLLDNAEQCEVVGVFRWSSRPESIHCWEPVEGTFEQLVRTSGLADIRCHGVNAFEFSALLEELRPDVLLIGAWGEILQSHLVERTDILLVNCHPSKLPVHRGANPYATVIREGETETGVSFHRVSKAIDAGAILLQETVPLSDADNGASVRDKCAEVAQCLVKELLARVSAHVLAGQPLVEVHQDDSQKSYFPPLKTEEGLLDWSAPVETLSRRIRALYPWIVCYSYLKGKRKVLFYDPHFVAVPPEMTATRCQPGEVVFFDRGVVRMATTNPAYRLEVSIYQIAGGRTYLPMWLGRLLSVWWFRPGQRFLSPSSGNI
jgi:methionyl-tRNA formyltransferase